MTYLLYCTEALIHSLHPSISPRLGDFHIVVVHISGEIFTLDQSISSYDDDWTKCIKEISKIENIIIGYYLPTDILTKCSKNKISLMNCKNIIKEIELSLLKNEIENVTFDIVGYDWLKNNKFLKKFKWNIWHIDDLDDLEKIVKQENIGILLLRNDKFTNYLN